MLSLLDGLRLCTGMSTGFMAGSGLYVSLVEVPSRRGLPIRALHQQFSRSFNLAARSMMVSGLLAGGTPTALYFLDESPVKNLWLVGPVCFLIGSIYSFAFIIPGVRLMLDADNIDKKGEGWFRGAVETWGKKHLFRTLVNGVNFTCMLLAIMWS